MRVRRFLRLAPLSDEGANTNDWAEGYNADNADNADNNNHEAPRSMMETRVWWLMLPLGVLMAIGLLLLVSVSISAAGEQRMINVFPENIHRIACTFSKGFCNWYSYDIPMSEYLTQVTSVEDLNSNKTIYWCMVRT